jgi:protein-S-isoprenylcysteine O-methyltransferase Ste14
MPSFIHKLGPVAGSIAFFMMAPLIVAGVAPYWITGWQWRTSTWSLIGYPLLLGGFLVLLDSIRRFALEGLGTPAPIYPTKHLVVTGLYRYVRNPMYLAVIGIIVAQALLCWSLKLLGYGFAVWGIFHIFVLAYEEPMLGKTYGSEYQQYCGKVCRWLPSSEGLRRVRS